MAKKPPFTKNVGAPTGALGAPGKAKDYLPRRERPVSEIESRPAKDKPKRPGPKPLDNRPSRPGSTDARKRVHGVVAAKAKPQPKTHTHWGDVAEWYDALVGDEGSEYHRKVIIPGVLRMLELNKIDADRPQMLDLACGQGVLCRRLAEEGCEVTGVDAAAPLLEAAKKRNVQDRLAIKYTLADVTELLADNGTPAYGLRAGTSDAVTIVLSIQNITPLSPVWEACHALLKPGGKLIVVMMHPCFRVPKQSDWLWDEASFTQLRAIRHYLGGADVEIQTHPGHAAHGQDDSTTTHFHRPLQAYVNTMGNAGLYIDNIQEWTSHKTDQAGPKKEAMDRARKEIPLFLALRARKV
ncbi:MAG: class I SAM-dependent methyltransferase [Bacillota bacterium]|nr:class I SAM-dependent methyltransferase [Bacillota bacterium]